MGLKSHFWFDLFNIRGDKVFRLYWLRPARRRRLLELRIIDWHWFSVVSRFPIRHIGGWVLDLWIYNLKDLFPQCRSLLWGLFYFLRVGARVEALKVRAMQDGLVAYFALVLHGWSFLDAVECLLLWDGLFVFSFGFLQLKVGDFEIGLVWAIRDQRKVVASCPQVVPQKWYRFLKAVEHDKEKFAAVIERQFFQGFKRDAERVILEEPVY